MIYKYFCSCGKEFVVEHAPDQKLEICTQVNESCTDALFLIREDYAAALRQADEQIREEMKHYTTDDQDVLRERLKRHADELNHAMELEKQNASKNSISPEELINKFRNRNDD